jgi:uncharacterized protein (DUF488 family)
MSTNNQRILADSNKKSLYTELSCNHEGSLGIHYKIKCVLAILLILVDVIKSLDHKHENQTENI